MAIRINCDQIICRIKQKNEEIELIKGDIQSCLSKLYKEKDGKKLSCDFGLRCLTAISITLPKEKSEWTSKVWNVTEIVSLVLICHDHILKTDLIDINVSRCLYSIFNSILDVDYVQTLTVSSRLLENLKRDVTNESIIPIARNCFARLWNAAILYERSRSVALKLRLESLSYLSFSPSEVSKFCSKSVHAAHVYAEHIVCSNDCEESNDFAIRILNMFRERQMAMKDVTSIALDLAENLIKLVRITLQVLLTAERFDLARSLIENARKTFSDPPKRDRSIVTFELNVFESFVRLTSILFEKSDKRGDTLTKTSELLTNCIAFLTNCNRDDDFYAIEKRLLQLVYFLRLQLQTIIEKVFTKIETSLNILKCVRPLSKLIVTMVRATRNVSINESLQLCYRMLLLDSYIVRALEENSEMFVEIVNDADKLVQVFASIVPKLTIEKLQDGISLFLSSTHTMINSLYQKKMYVECPRFVYPYVGFLIQSYCPKDETKLLQFWKKMNGLVFCLNRAKKYKESLQVIAEFLAKDLGQDKEAMALWVTVKREALRTDVTLASTDTKSLVSPLIRSNSETKRIRLVGLLKEELEAFRTEVFAVEDVLHVIISDLIELAADDPLEMSYALVQMGRFLLHRHPDYDRKWNPTKCCREALKQLERSKLTKKKVVVFGSIEDNLAAQAKFIMFLAEMETRYAFLEEKVTKQERKMTELRKKQREDVQKTNPAASETIDDDNNDEMVTYDSSTLEEEFRVLSELDSCVELWRSILDENSDGIIPFVVDFLQDLKCATEIYASARFYSQEVSTWELFLTLAKRSERWTDYIDGVARFGTTLSRLGLTDRAESLLEEATIAMNRLDQTDSDVLILTVSLLLAKSELHLMKNSIAKGWEELCLATRSIKESRRTKAMMLLHSVALALESKYCELPTFVHIDLSERETTPVEAMASAVRLCSSLLTFCSKDDGQTMTMLFKQRLLGCIVDCSFRLSQLHYNLGSIRDARCFLREVSSWSRRYFFVNRTVDVMLLQSRIDLLLDETSLCQVKLNEVQHIMDSTDVTLSSTTIDRKTLVKNKNSPVANAELDDDNHDDGFSIASPICSDRFLAISSTISSSSSPCFNMKRTVSSLNEHDIKCKCVRCKHIVIHQLRVEALFVRHELMGMPIETMNEVLKKSKISAAIEKFLVAKIGDGKPVSQIEISSCWMMSRMVEKQIEEGSVRLALKLVTKALEKLNTFHRDGIGQLHFLDATLKYQKCLAQIILLARREGKSSVSQLYDTMWTTSINEKMDVVVEDLTSGIANIDIAKTSSDFKTPKHGPPLKRILKSSSSVHSKILSVDCVTKEATSSTKKSVQFTCAAPIKKRPQMSVFESVFSPTQELDLDSDSEKTKKKPIDTIIILDEDDDDHHHHNNDSLTGFNSANITPSKTSVLPLKCKKSALSLKKKPSSKEVVDRLKVLTISDKENSDSDDFSPLKSLSKRRPPLDSILDVINVDFEGSPLRNMTPIRDKDSFNVERVRDDTKTDDDDEVPVKQTTSRKVSKLVVDSVGRRTRSKSASTVEEVEINRGGEGLSSKKTEKNKKKKIGGTKKTTTNECDFRSPGLDGEADQMFTMDSVISTLDTTVRYVEHHPNVPLYGDLNLLLALCKGERNVSSVGHILESVGITLRHYTCDRLGNNLRSLTAAASASTNDAITSDIDASNMEIRRKLIGFSEGLLKFKDGDDDGNLKQVTDKLPKDWVVCQINKLPDVLTGNAKNPELFLTRLENGRKPVVVKIDCSNRTRGARDFLSELNDIVSEMKEKIRLTSAEAWWRIRREFDTRLKTLLQSAEDVWLGPWKCLLLGRPQQETDRKKLREATKQILRDILPLKLPFVNEHLIELVVDCWPWLKSEHLNVALAHSCGVSSSDSRLRKMCSIVNDRICDLWSIGMSRKVVILILDKTVHCFPWENLPILRAYSVSRMPSVHFLLGHLAVHLPKDNSDMNVVGPTVDPLKSSFYIVNPSGDLVRTQNHFQTVFNDELKWPGIVGRPPTKDEWTNTLTTKDLFVYCGHGAGSLYAAGEVIEKKVCRATTILMGCSSAILRKQGRNLEAHGIILQYLIAGCPCVIGNLWDVTDKDIDKLTETLIKKWIPEPDHKDNKCILDCLSLARDVTILKYLVGSAPVTYGIPVYSQTTC